MRGADLHSTAGCHPTSTSEIDSYPGGSERYLADLRTLIMEDRGEGGSKRVISVGEIGLGGCGAAPSRRQIELPPIPQAVAVCPASSSSGAAEAPRSQRPLPFASWAPRILGDCNVLCHLRSLPSVSRVPRDVRHYLTPLRLRPAAPLPSRDPAQAPPSLARPGKGVPAPTLPPLADIRIAHRSRRRAEGCGVGGSRGGMERRGGA